MVFAFGIIQIIKSSRHPRYHRHLKPIHSERKRNFSMMFVIYFSYFFACRLILSLSHPLSLGMNKPLHTSRVFKRAIFTFGWGGDGVGELGSLVYFSAKTTWRQNYLEVDLVPAPQRHDNCVCVCDVTQKPLCEPVCVCVCVCVGQAQTITHTHSGF